MLMMTPFEPTHSPSPATPWTAAHFLENLLRNNHEFWWEKLFRFTRIEFFEQLVPVLDLPDRSSVDGYVGTWACMHGPGGMAIDSMDESVNHAEGPSIDRSFVRSVN